MPLARRDLSPSEKPELTFIRALHEFRAIVASGTASGNCVFFLCAALGRETQILSTQQLLAGRSASHTSRDKIKTCLCELRLTEHLANPLPSRGLHQRCPTLTVAGLNALLSSKPYVWCLETGATRFRLSLRISHLMGSSSMLISSSQRVLRRGCYLHCPEWRRRRLSGCGVLGRFFE